MKLSLAVAGKGGTGKTTLSALLIRALMEAQAGAILAVDAAKGVACLFATIDA